MPLAQALEILRKEGIDLLYSSQLVQPQLRVLQEPRSQAPQSVLAEILAPHGLEARPVAQGRLVVVRASAAAAEATSDAGSELHGSLPLDEVLVHASRYELLREVPASLALERAELGAMPGVEQDVIRSLQRIPGSASGGLSATAHVRGAYDDEVLMRFDGVRLYEPFHLKDFLNLFGAVDPELVDSVNLYSGGFPVEFGDRAAGVLDMRPRRTSGHETLIGASVINNRLISSGSHGGERGHWLLGYRRSNLAAVIRQLDRDVGEPQFEDLLVRYEYQLTPALNAAAGLMLLEDDHELFTLDRQEEARARYGDDAAWLRLEYADAGGWSLGLQAAHSHLTARRNGSASRVGVSSGTLTESRVATIDDLRLTWALRTAPRIHWRAGLELSRGETLYDYDAAAQFEEPLASAFGRPGTLNQSVTADIDGDAVGAWLAARGELGAVTLDLGVRFDERSWIEGDEKWSPRVSLRYDLGERTVLRASAGRFVQSQSLNELEVEEPAPQFAQPETSRQWILGLEQRLAEGLQLRVEVFGREARTVRARFENVLDPLVLLPEIEIDRVRVAPESSRSRGVEVTLHGEAGGGLSWWGSYTWSRSEDRFAQADAPRSWDQRNAVLLGATWSSGPWQLSAVGGYISGWPFTDLRFEGPPAGDGSGFTTATLGERNGEDFEDRLLLDLRGQYSVELPLGQLEFFAEVRNAASRGNDCCRDVEISPLAGGAFAADVRQRKWLGMVPLAGINWRF